MRTRRTFTAEFKRKIVSEAEIRPIDEICNEYDLQVQLIHRWKREFASNPKKAFSGHGNVWKDDARIAQLERKIGQQAMTIDLLKKSIAHQEELRQEEKRKRRCLR